jgi:hypothetical protein
MTTLKTPPPALPVWSTVSRAYASVSENWLAVLRIGWAWVAVLTIAGLLFVVTFPTDMDQFSLLPIIAALALLTAFFVAFSSVAVAWHRLMLLNEQPPSLYLRVDARVRRYLGKLILISLIATVIQLICSSALFSLLLTLMPVNPNAAFSFDTQLRLAIIGFVSSLPMVLVVARLSVSLPGTAVERPISLGDTMRVTRGNTWRLFGGSLLVYLPAYLVSVLGLAASASSSANLANVVISIVYFFSAIAAIGFLSLSYRFFMRQ